MNDPRQREVKITENEFLKNVKFTLIASPADRPEGQPNWTLLTQATDSNPWVVEDDPEGRMGVDRKIG